MAKGAVHLRVLPETRAECRNGARPCPLVSCRFHLLLDIGEDGRLLKARDFDENDAMGLLEALAAMPETCALDVAARGGVTSVFIAELIGLRRQGVEEIIGGVADQFHPREREDFEEREHPEDFYLKYTNMGAAELAEIAAELRRKAGR